MTQTNPILPEVRAGTVSREALVQAALKEITQNYREASLSNVAREYGVSLAYVSECVRAETGRTYKELLQKHRMETAARLLRRSDMNIQQIISLVGYENTSYFYRLFHERYGQSPREYRQSRPHQCMNHSLTRQNRAQQTPCPVLLFRNVLWQIDAKNWIFMEKWSTIEPF